MYFFVQGGLYIWTKIFEKQNLKNFFKQITRANGDQKRQTTKCETSRGAKK